MEPNDSNIKPQPTGGLKLMTVFVVVLALHVVVIGGITTYYLLKGGSTDADLTTDKTHKSAKDGALASDGQMPDTSDKNTTASTASADAGVNAPAPTPTPEADQAVSTDSNGASTTQSLSPPSAPTIPALAPPDASSTAATGIPFHTGAPNNPPIVLAPATSVIESPAPAPVADLNPAPATPPVPAADGASYVVKAHDSLSKIAHLNHTSVAKLKAANSLNSDLLRIGQKLIIPVPGKTSAVATAVATTTPDASVNAATPSGPIPASTAPAPATTAATASAPPALNHHIYTVVKGDTLTKIAHKFNTTPTALMTANSITDPAKLSIGKKLKIPSKEARSAKISAPAAVPTAPGQAKTGTPTALANVDQQ